MPRGNLADVACHVSIITASSGT
ncbi:hypothetical protein CCACVL1_03996 [Corchorus capsularis]|uniref:Uncharacterized protein n=1 Tax=Corchorus capsularis TaxID=210143 RepID=A0A1R3JVW8_COCAP|nr:hypothetical protein CCACVL1_03996 [Corchorus capsularis]